MSQPFPHEQPLPFITLPNWVKAAALCGFNIQPVFDELEIETDLLHLEDATISRPLLEQVMTVCVARARDQHFPFVLGETFAFDYLPDIGTRTEESCVGKECVSTGRIRWSQAT